MCACEPVIWENVLQPPLNFRRLLLLQAKILIHIPKNWNLFSGCYLYLKYSDIKGNFLNVFVTWN